MRDDEAVRAALETIFDADTGIYRERGFQRRVGFGTRPALVHIDLANAWTRPGNPFTCDGMDVIIPGVQRLNAAGRAKGIPIAFFFTGTHDDYHANTDSVDKIRFPKLVRAADLIYRLGFGIANSEERLARDNRGSRSGKGFSGPLPK